MSQDEDLIDSHVSITQCRKAVEALHSHQLKETEKFDENQLLPSKEQHIWLNVTVKQVAPVHKVKPHKIPIAHPLVDPRTTSICLITKDPQREYKDLLESHNIKFISRVVGIEKLKGKFKPFEARRMLLKENGMFLADNRVISILPKLLGSKWFEAKKQPIPVNLTKKDLKAELERAISSTYMHQNRGTCTAIKVGKMSQKPSQIVENIKTAIPAIAKAIPLDWDNIQNLHIKTNSSVSLPIWSCALEDPIASQWHGCEVVEGSASKEGDNEVDGDNIPAKTKESKSRKRSGEEETETPRKKTKPANQPEGNKDVLKKAKHGVQESLKKQVQKTTGPSKSPVHEPSLRSKASAPDIKPHGAATSSAATKLKKGETQQKFHDSIEKKKLLFAKAKGGKSIKNAFLGRKVAQG